MSKEIDALLARIEDLEKKLADLTKRVEAAEKQFPTVVSHVQPNTPHVHVEYPKYVHKMSNGQITESKLVNNAVEEESAIQQGYVDPGSGKKK